MIVTPEKHLLLPSSEKQKAGDIPGFAFTFRKNCYLLTLL